MHKFSVNFLFFRDHLFLSLFSLPNPLEREWFVFCRPVCIPASVRYLSPNTAVVDRLLSSIDWLFQRRWLALFLYRRLSGFYHGYFGAVSYFLVYNSLDMCWWWRLWRFFAQECLFSDSSVEYAVYENHPSDLRFQLKI